jgi:hypothetical protein
MAVDRVTSEPFSASNSRSQGNLQGISSFWRQKHTPESLYQAELRMVTFDNCHSFWKTEQGIIRESKQNPAFIDFRLGTLRFADDKLHAPLQAADIAAYELWRWLDEHFALKPRHGRYSLQELVKLPWTIREFDRGGFEEMQVQRKGGRVDKKIVHYVISALRSGLKDKQQCGCLSTFRVRCSNKGMVSLWVCLSGAPEPGTALKSILGRQRPS